VSGARILVVEDEAAMRRGLSLLLGSRGFTVLEAETGPEALVKARQAAPDLILLDVMLPGLNGFDVLQTLRSEGLETPVILLTAKGAELDRVMGFSLGVDDYVTKPFSSLELVGRIEAVLRRCRTAPRALPPVLALGACEVDFGRMLVLRDGQAVKLPGRALAILAALAQAEGRVVTRDALCTDGCSPRTVDNMVVKLRQVLEERPDEPRHLLTVHGQGFRLVTS
jgi:DNA-binding response OmpR family regulator